MSERIPQSSSKRVVFRAFLSSDHVTPATGKTIAITISKNGGAFANPAAGATNATEIASGFYYFDLGTGDTDTLGPLAYRGAEGTIDDVGDCYTVATGLEFAANVTQFGGVAGTFSGGRPEVNVSHISGDSAAADNCEAWFDGTGYAGTNNVIPTVTTVNGLAAGVITEASIAADAITAAKIATGAIDADAIAADAITAAKIADGAIDAATFAAGAINAAAIADGAIDAATFTGGTLLDAAGIRAALGLAAANLDTQLSGVPTAVWGAGTRQLTGTQTFNLTGSITGNLSGSVGSVSGSVASVAGAVGSVTGDVGGNVAGSVGSVTGLTTATIAAAVWGYTLEGAMTAIHWARIVLAALAGKSSGHSTSSPAYRDLADTKNRITATTDADGRTSVTLDGS